MHVFGAKKPPLQSRTRGSSSSSRDSADPLALSARKGPSRLTFRFSRHWGKLEGKLGQSLATDPAFSRNVVDESVASCRVWESIKSRTGFEIFAGDPSRAGESCFKRSPFKNSFQKPSISNFLSKLKNIYQRRIPRWSILSISHAKPYRIDFLHKETTRPASQNQIGHLCFREISSSRRRSEVARFASKISWSRGDATVSWHPHIYHVFLNWHRVRGILPK
jgi:hypothetical protein